MNKNNTIKKKQLRDCRNKEGEKIRENILFFIQNATAPCRTSEIFQHFGLSAYQARHYLQSLEREGKIRRTPPRRGAKTLWETAKQK